MVYKIPPGGGGKPYLASGLLGTIMRIFVYPEGHQLLDLLP